MDITEKKYKRVSKSFQITKKDMIEALNRSGYILESEVSKVLLKEGFFIETNQVIVDPYTKKSREVDIVAEYHDWSEKSKDFYEAKASADFTFVMEIKNNTFPLVLLTDFNYHPNSIAKSHGLKEFITLPNEVDVYDSWNNSYQRIIPIEEELSIFTQYCSFQKKKSCDELMALHPDDFHDSLLKITRYCEETIKEWNEYFFGDSKYFRHWLYLPMILVNDDLYEFRDGILTKVDSSILVHNYHFNEEKKSAYVFVVTKKGLSSFIKKMTKIRNELEQELIKIRFLR